MIDDWSFIQASSSTDQDPVATTHTAGDSQRYSRLRHAVMIVMSSAILSWPLLWNRFPLVYWDTAIYLSRWAIGAPSFDHPIYYSLWLGLFSFLPYGLVFCVLFQSLITGGLLFILVSHVVSESRVSITFALSTLAIAISPTAFHIMTLMPDVATTWLGLAAPILILGKTNKLRIMSVGIIVVSFAFHSSHVLILAAAMPVMLLVMRALRVRVLVTVALIALAMVGQFAMMGLNNYLAGAPFLESPLRFMIVARLNQSGALEKSLRETANDERYQGQQEEYLSWADSISKMVSEPEPVLWADESPLNLRYPGWTTNIDNYMAAKEFLRPVAETGLRNHLNELLHSGKHNVTSMMVGEYLFLGYIRHEPGLTVWKALDSYWPSDLPRYSASRQGSGELPATTWFTTWKRLFYSCSMSSILLSVVLSLLAISFLFFRRRLPAYLGASLVLIAVFQTNVIACGFLSSIATRYIERAIGLYLLAVVLLTVGCYESVRSGAFPTRLGKLA